MLSIVILTIVATITLYLGFQKQRGLIIPFGLLGLIFSLFCLVNNVQLWNEWMQGLMSVDSISKTISIIILVAAIFILPFFNLFNKRGNEEVGDVIGLFLFSLVGIIMMVSYRDMIILFLGVEIVSIAMYILAGADRRKLSSNEASLKYFIMGAFGSAILLFGIALFYVSTGTMNLDKLTNINFSSLSQLSVLIIFCGLAFKVALVPFHFWAPDVYEGTPTIYTGIMATIVKIGAFGAMYQFITLGSGFIPSWMFWLISFIALASMLLGNIMALGQTSMKRLLAYSSIVQAGFIVIGFINITPQNAWQVIYYLVAYTLASLVCFFSIHFIEEQKGTDQISAAENLYSENPFLAIVFSIALISLGGIPLTAGFMAKFFILNNAAYNNSITLVVIALILAVVSMYYYFRLINMMFTNKINAINWKIGWMYQFLFVILSVLTIAFGTMPALIVDWLK